MNKWIILGKIHSSSYRRNILLSLIDSNKIPTEIAKDSGVKVSHVSNILSELLGMKIIRCLTPELRKGKIYSLTPLGKKIMKLLK